MKKINVAVIGLGYWGPNLVRNLLKTPGISNVYACDLLKDNLTKVKQDFPNVNIINSYSKILADNDIDAVLIATPIKTHFELTKKALLSKKHVFVEKPMASTAKEAKELIELSKKQKRTLMVGHTFVYTDTVEKIKELLDKKEIGKVYYYDSTRINLGLFQNDANVIWDLAPHDLSIIRFLFPQKPISVQAFGSSFIGNKIELAHIFIKLQENITVNIHVSWLSPLKIRRTLIGGSKKMIVYDDIEPSEKIKVYDKGVIPPKSSITPFAPAYRSGDVVIPKLEQKEALLKEMSHFVECIIKSKKPRSSKEEGLAVVELLEAIDKAIKTHAEIIL